jgi:hypothetical protein
MMPNVNIAIHGEEASSDRRIARLAAFLGLRTTVIKVSQASSLETSRRNSGCVVVSARSLAAMLRDESLAPEFASEFLHNARFVLVYGITGEETQTAAISSISDGLVSTVISFNASDYCYQVSADHRDLAGEFTGLRFGPVNVQTDHALVLKDAGVGVSNIVSIHGHPFFVRLQRASTSLFLLACSEVADVDAVTDGSFTARKYFSHLAPVMMFLRYVFPDQTWHNRVRCANLIIDDPLLRKSYGHLSYSRLLETMDQSGFSSSIAFIPWNYTRTDPAVARVVKERSDKLCLCVHGCDHTAGEFATKDVAELDRLTYLATHRMEAHRELTAVPYAKVMVFPQGRFSSTSLAVLKKQNYLAALNSSVVAEDARSTHGLTVRDLLFPAVCKYSSFPLFGRRYPRNVEDFAFDLFAGKPALVVEHHNYFKDGYTKVAGFVSQLNALSPNLRWMGIDEVVMSTYLQKTASPDVIDCMIFSNRHIIRNDEPTTKTFRISKHDDNSSATVTSVEINGTAHAHRNEDGAIQFIVDIPASSVAEVAIHYSNSSQYRPVPRNQLWHGVKVYVRRYLSEVRDNYISKNARLLSLANRIKNMGRTA